MSRKFCKAFNKSQTFNDWLDRLKRFNCALIKENNLQLWTMADYRAFWDKHKGR